MRHASRRTTHAAVLLGTLLTGLAMVLPTGAAAQADPDGPFRMTVLDAFTVTGVGTVVTGRIEQGTVSVEDAVELVGPDGATATVVLAMEQFRRVVETASAGDDVGLVLEGVEVDDVQRGMVLAAPGTVDPGEVELPGGPVRQEP